jgi:Tol biopolymer transport system component
MFFESLTLARQPAPVFAPRQCNQPSDDDPGLDRFPVWTRDGRRIAFSSQRAGAPNLFWQAADGTGPVERLTESSNEQNPTSVAPAGTPLVFYEVASSTARATSPSFP